MDPNHLSVALPRLVEEAPGDAARENAPVLSKAGAE
jgi:hypothetical protein